MKNNNYKYSLYTLNDITNFKFPEIIKNIYIRHRNICTKNLRIGRVFEIKYFGTSNFI